MKKIFTSFICIMIVVCLTAAAAGQSDLNNILNKKNELQQSINAEKDKKSTAQKEYQVIENNMLALQNEINKINARLTELEAEEKQINEELNVAIENQEKQEKILNLNKAIFRSSLNNICKYKKNIIK